ncbi:hypothetical protein ACF1BP_30750 [Streptomyces sp. NPDC014735]|uniref:hypothetical protein n=1 Tax=unclassified Streptomyces TaxID=2593676 RepID=UPI0036F4BC2F
MYADGGLITQTFLRECVLDELTITTAPVLLGAGVPPFGHLDRGIDLIRGDTRAPGSGFVRTTCTVDRAAAG